MVFTVGLPDGTRDYEYEVYVRLLEKAGVNLASAKRVPDPANGKRWLAAWQNRQEAEEFAACLRAETENLNWKVSELSGVEPSTGPLGPIVILVGRQSDGLSYSLSQSSRKLISKMFPAANITPSVFVSTTQPHVESTHGRIWDQVAIILSGLSANQLERLGGYEVYDPATRKLLREPVPLPA